MGRSKAVLAVTALAAAAVGGAWAALKAREKNQTVNDAVAGMETQLVELDPVTRAAVGAKVATQAVSDMLPNQN
ncbi:MAG TPA: hypothetical protein VIM19_13410 [Actinomycetes bacterium]